jgi:N-acetylmuramoyl-L-alanine amidase
VIAVLICFYDCAGSCELPGTWLAASQSTRKHVISSGDTLITIANCYQVSVKRLRNANDLKSDTIRIGQILQIPTGG